MKKAGGGPGQLPATCRKALYGVGVLSAGSAGFGLMW